jgi:hypothetical protein
MPRRPLYRAEAVLSPLTLLVLLSAPPAARADRIYGLTDDQMLISWESSDPGMLLTSLHLNPMNGPDVATRAMDWRFTDQEGLYLVGTIMGGSVLGQVNLVSGSVSTTNSPTIPVSGPSMGMDFSPLPSATNGRVVSSIGHNARFSVPFGSPGTREGDIHYAAGDAHEGDDADLSHIAWDWQSLPTLYGIDVGNDVLVRMNPTTGALTTIGQLGLNATEWGGFDIAIDGTAFAVLGTPTSSMSSFYTIDLNTGAATLIGEVGGGLVITAMTIPEPASAALILIGLALRLVRRERTG